VEDFLKGAEVKMPHAGGMFKQAEDLTAKKKSKQEDLF
jgi:hypothetical protein